MLAADSGSRVASVSLKDRGAVLPAGRTKGRIYWFEADVARFVTSTYYRTSYPGWVDRFNARDVMRLAADTVWASTIPAKALARTLPDTMASERRRAHLLPASLLRRGRGNLAAWLEATPMLDALAMRFARYCRRGARARSRRGAGLPQRVALADGPHRTRVRPAQPRDARQPAAARPRARRVLLPARRARRSRKLGPRLLGGPRLGRDSGGRDGGRRAPRAPHDRRGAASFNGVLVDSLERSEWWPRSSASPSSPTRGPSRETENPSPADSFATLFRRSLYPGRVGGDFGRWGVEVRYAEGFLSNVRGTSHGRPYWYDRHVPLIFLGPGVARGRDTTRASTADVAPTLARLACRSRATWTGKCSPWARARGAAAAGKGGGVGR